MKMQIFKFASTLFLSLIACSSVVVESQEQTYPNMTFLYENLANHSYVNITELGDVAELSVQCHTDLITCCTTSQGPHRGDWYSPNGAKLNFFGSVYQNRNLRRTDLRRENDVVSPTGIYRCGIPTIAVHDDSDIFLRASIYIGVYTSSGGNIDISDVALYVTSNLNGPSPQFTLTCISTDGPATTVTWTRDSIILTEGTETVLNDTVTAQYIHTLTLTGRLPGLYTCTVSNNKPSSDSQSINLEVGSTPTDLTASRTDPNHIQVNWTPPPSPNNNYGYIIFYTDTAVGSTTDNVTINVVSVNGYLLSGLSAGVEYNITLVGSSHFFSDPISVVVPALPPNSPSITDISSTQTTITLTWIVPSPSAVTEYIVKWQKITTSCPNEDFKTRVITTTDLSHSDTITELQKGSNYSVSVTARNSAGNSTSQVVSITTEGNIPSGAPSDVTLINVTENSITFQWGPLPCIHRNGEIKSYIITYNEQGYLNTSKTESVLSTLPDAGVILTISGLVAEVAYSVRIAAVNMNGTATNTSGFNVITTGIRNDVCTYSSITFPHMTTSVSSSSSSAYESTSAPPPTQETVTMADDRDSLSTRDILKMTSVDIISSTPLVETTTVFVTVAGPSSCSEGSNGIGPAVGAGAGVAVAIIILLAGGGVVILFLRKTYRQRRNKYSLRDNNMSMKTNTGINMAYGMTPSNRETVIDEDNETEYEVIKNQYANVGPPPDLPNRNLVGPPPALPSRHLTATYEIDTPPNIRQQGMEQTEKTSQVYEEDKEDKELYTLMVNNT